MAASFLPFLAVLFLAAVAPAIEAATAIPCTQAQLGFNVNQVLFDTTSLLCSQVWEAPQDFLLLYKKENSTTWNFILSAPTTSDYISIAFATAPQMVGASAIVGWATSDGGTAKQYYLGGKIPSQVVADTGNLTLAPGKTTIFSQGQRMYLTFQVTGLEKPTSYLLYAVGPTPGSDNVLSHHTARTGATFPTEQTAPSPSGSASPAPGGSPGSESGTPGSESPESTPPLPQSSAGRIAVTAIPAISIILAMILV